MGSGHVRMGTGRGVPRRLARRPAQVRLQRRREKAQGTREPRPWAGPTGSPGDRAAPRRVTADKRAAEPAEEARKGGGAGAAVCPAPQGPLSSPAGSPQPPRHRVQLGFGPEEAAPLTRGVQWAADHPVGWRRGAHSHSCRERTQVTSSTAQLSLEDGWGCGRTTKISRK